MTFSGTGDSCPVRTVPYIYMGGWGPTRIVNFITDWDYPAWHMFNCSLDQ